MSIYVIADLHLSFKEPKPMNIFGNNWTDHPERIRKNWLEKVKERRFSGFARRFFMGNALRRYI